MKLGRMPLKLLYNVVFDGDRQGRLVETLFAKTTRSSKVNLNDNIFLRVILRYIDKIFLRCLVPLNSWVVPRYLYSASGLSRATSNSHTI